MLYIFGYFMLLLWYLLYVVVILVFGESLDRVVLCGNIKIEFYKIND